MDLESAASTDPARWFEEAVVHYHNRQIDEATNCCNRALELAPSHAAALNLAGVIAFEARNLPHALERFAAAACAAPESAVMRVHLGNVQLDLGDLPAALGSYDAALALDHGNAEAYYGRGNALFDLGHLENALASFDAAIAARPDFIAAHDNRALTLYRLRRFEAAIGGFEHALRLDATSASLHCHFGTTLLEVKRPEPALASFENALHLSSGYIDAWIGRGNALAALNRMEEALASYARAIELNPRFAAGHVNRGNVLERLGRDDEALASYQRALECGPMSADTHRNRANLLRKVAYKNTFLERSDPSIAAAAYARAIDGYVQAIALNPHLDFLRGLLRLTRMQICDWQCFDEDLALIVAGVERGQALCPPFCLQALIDDPPLHLSAARIWVESMSAAPDRLGPLPRPARSERIRIGYFSPDFRIHPVSLLVAEMLEQHDRSAFEIFAFSFGSDSRDPMRQRIERAVEHFVDVRERSDRDVALLARQLNIEIAVDLSGFTENCRPQIFELRAAPLQLGYIGSLGTSGADYMDYLIADEVLIPPGERAHYSEQILYLPSYQANCSQREIAEHPASRGEAGLPEQGFVFCCFNTNYKISPQTFESWMRIIAAVPDSVLFLSADSDVAVSNLRREAASRGIDPERLLFGGRLPYPEYLARYRLADLFLDTFPYNAGATASDALWTGLPVLTMSGRSMHARMAASLLTAAGVPELITDCRDQYEQTAIELAFDPARLAELRQRLATQRSVCALFDTRRFTRGLEQAYRSIYDRLD